MNELINSWLETAEAMQKLAQTDPKNAHMWRGAAAAWKQAANELQRKLEEVMNG